MIPSAIIKEILSGYRLPIKGRHGVAHWGRVLENGLKVAKKTGANIEVIELFAVFHDARRQNESIDHGHGQRGAELAIKLRSKHLAQLSDEDFDLLVTACIHHTDGTTQADITVQTCWDADRLDLWRVPIIPKPSFLCTDAARDPEVMEWARKRSESNFEPAFVRDEWLAR